jgi:ClpP class serine protease
VGSIGTYGAIFDYSGAAAMEGVKAYVVRAGKYKGMGTPGTEITQDHLAELQRNVDALNARFLSGVSTGRRMNSDRVAELADGRVHIGAEALALGLVDAVGSFDAAMQRLQTITHKRSMRNMQAEHITPQADVPTLEASKTIAAPAANAPQAATYEQLKAGCYGADAAFIVAQLEAKATLADAQSAWMQAQQLKIAAAEKKAEQATAARPGVAPISGTEAAKPTQQNGGSATEQFFGLVKEQQAAGRSKEQAMLKVVAENPDLHTAMLGENRIKRGR